MVKRMRLSIAFIRTLFVLFLNLHTVATNNICLGRNVFGNYGLLWARTAF